MGWGDAAPRHRKLLGAPPNPDHPPACCPREFQAVCVNLAQRLTRSRCPPPRHHPAPLIRTLRYPPPRPPADQGISQGCTGHHQWEGSGAAGPFRLRSLRVPLGGGIGLGGPCTPRRRGVGEREGVRVPGRRFQESPASLPERPGREGTQRAYELGGREAGGRGGGADARSTARPAPATLPAGGPYDGDSSEPPLPPL